MDGRKDGVMGGYYSVVMTALFRARIPICFFLLLMFTFYYSCRS
jgi:uncharacterized membrane protein